MKKMLRIMFPLVFCIILCLCLAPTACAGTIASGACGANGSNLTWELSDQGKLIIRGWGDMGGFNEGTAPWYTNRSQIISVSISNEVTSIGRFAFYNCSNITEISIPDSVANIDSYAFSGCSSLFNIILPENITCINNSTFRKCTQLKSIVIPINVTSIGSSAFAWCENLMSIVIPSSVTSIGSDAFEECSSLMSITLPDGIACIEMGTFGGCSSLTNVVIPDGVKRIESYAFGACKNLATVTIPESVISIGDSAFTNCWNLQDVIIPQDITSIEGGTFYNCASLTKVDIPKNVTKIGASAFHGCSSLTKIAIPDGVTSLSDYAFCDCTSLASVIIPKSVKIINTYAFDNCPNLTIVCYGGSKEDRNSIQIKSNNSVLVDASWYFNGNIPETITISFYPNGGSGTMSNQLVVSGNTVKINKNSFGWNNHIFINWLDQNGNSYADQETITPTDDLMLFAQWNRSGYSIYFDGNTGEGRMPTKWVRAGSSITLPASSFTAPEGKMFLAWNTNADGSGISYKEGDSFTPDDDLTFYAQWAVVYTISFYPNGGNGDYQTQTVPKDLETKMKTILELGFVAPSGMSFVGWNTKADGSGVSYPDGASIRVVDDLSLYAIWIAKPDFVLPDSLVQIGEEAFVCGAFTYVKLSEQTKSIGRLAFADCPNLKYIYIPETTTSIDRYAFAYVNGLTILGKAGSEAETYANKYHYPFVAVS